jgi:hypothetical protein
MNVAIHVATLCLLLPVACGEGQPAVSGIGEPIRVTGGQYIAGDLPSSAGGPAITATAFNNQNVLLGEAGKAISGRAQDAAFAVGVRFGDLGTGYWVVPVTEPDPQFPGEITFGFSADFDANIPAGFHPLRFVAIDAAGHGGAPMDTPLCVAGRIPDNLHACLPSTPPPAVVISLRWDTNFDVDLHVLIPSGVDVNPKSPLTQPMEAGTAPDSNAPRIDRDSLGGCVHDGLRQEDLVFQTAPPPGSYQIRVDPFDACGQSAVRFELTIFKAMGACPACSLQPIPLPPSGALSQAGELLASQATGGASSGLYVLSVSL